MAHAVTLHSLPLFVRLAGRPVMLLGDGDAADAKRRLLDRAGAAIVGEDATASLAIVAIDDEADALAAIARLKARGVLVNAVDRPAYCDFTLPAIVDRAPVIVAIGTGGVSAGLAAALRQRLEALLPANLGQLAQALHAARGRLRAAFPDAGNRRRALAAAMAAGGAIDPLGGGIDVDSMFDPHDGDVVPATTEPVERAAVLAPPGGLRNTSGVTVTRMTLASPDPDDLTLRQARTLASADRVYHRPDVPPAILERARADAARIVCTVMPVDAGDGLSVDLEMRA